MYIDSNYEKIEKRGEIHGKEIGRFRLVDLVDVADLSREDIFDDG